MTLAARAEPEAEAQARLLAPVAAADQRRVGRSQVVDLPPVRPLVYEAQRVRVRCRHCQHTTVGALPAGYADGGRFGPRLLATVTYLHEEHHVAYARLVTLLQERFGLTISEGTLVALVEPYTSTAVSLAPTSRVGPLPSRNCPA